MKSTNNMMLTNLKSTGSFKLLFTIAIAVVIILAAGCKPKGVKPTSNNTSKRTDRFLAKHIKAMGEYFSQKENTGRRTYYTSKDFKNPPKLEKTLAVLSNYNVKYTTSLRAEILGRHYYVFKKEIYQKIFDATTWYSGQKSNNVKFDAKMLNSFERENISRIKKIDNQGYPIDFWDIPDKDELEVIRKKIGAEDLTKIKNKYFVRFFWPFGVGIAGEEDVEWKTNLTYIGEIKQLDKESLADMLYNNKHYVELKKAEKENMDTYRDETKKEYEDRLKEADEEIDKIDEFEKLGGPLIPQGTIIYDSTGYNLKAKITSWLDPEWVGVYAPIQEYREGQQELYSYNAKAFGGIEVISDKYINLGTAFGSVYIDYQKGYTEYVFKLTSGISKLDSKGNVITDNMLHKVRYDAKGNIINREFDYFTFNNSEKIPKQITEGSMLLNYDPIHKLAWGVKLNKPLVKYNIGWGKYSVFASTNLEWIAGYLRNAPTGRKHYKTYLRAFRYPGEFDVKYVRAFAFDKKVYVGGRDRKNDNIRKYIYLETMDTLLGKDKTKYIVPEDGRLQIHLDDRTIFQGVPALYNLPYAFNWSAEVGQENELWIDIYKLETKNKIKRIRIKNLEIGKHIIKYVLKRKLKRKLKKIPRVRYIKYIGNDMKGLIYFEVRVDIDLYDYAPLVIAVDMKGNLKLLARLWSAAGDKSAIKDGARMGPSYYAYKAVALPGGGIFTVWNSKKGVGLGKFSKVK